MSEHLKYGTQLIEYWLNKSTSLNIVQELQPSISHHTFGILILSMSGVYLHFKTNTERQAMVLPNVFNIARDRTFLGPSKRTFSGTKNFIIAKQQNLSII